MIGYLAGLYIGARTYNAFHNHLIPILLGFAGVIVEFQILTAISTIWVAHIGIDRALGYGLKYQTGFKDTHLTPTTSE